MGITIHTDTLSEALHVFEEFSQGKEPLEKLQKLLSHPHYLLEIKRYQEIAQRFGQSSPTQEDILHLWSSQNHLLTERWLKRKNFMTQILSLPHSLKSQILNLSYLCKNQENYILFLLEDALPQKITLPHDVIILLGIGPSGGYFYENKIFLDLLSFFPDFEEDLILRTIAHECHHIEYQHFLSRQKIQNHFTYPWHLIAGEGLAVYYCNNAEGILSQRKNLNAPANVGMHLESWNWMKENTSLGFQTLITLCPTLK